MRRSSRRFAVTSSVLFATMVLGAVPVLGQAPGGGDPLRGKCTASAKARGGEFNVKVRWRCDFKVSVISLQTTKKITRVMGSPQLDPAPAEGGLLCKRTKDRRARCDRGEIEANTRITESLRVKGGPCKKPRLKIDALVKGGLDCGDDPCPAISLGSKTSLTVGGC